MKCFWRSVPSYEKTDQQLFVVDDNRVTPADVGNESDGKYAFG